MNMKSKKRKLEWFSSFTRKFNDYINIDAKIPANDVETFLLDILMKSTLMLNEASDNGIIDELVTRYANGEQILGQRSQETRNEYAAVLNQSILPTYYRRRIFDASIVRIQDLLKVQATRKIVAQLIHEYHDMTDGEIAQEYYKRKKSGIIPKYIGYVTSTYVKNIHNQMKKNDDELPPVKPSFTPKLQMSRMDNFAMVTRSDKNTCVLSFHCGNRTAKLTYQVPSKPDYQSGKICKPDITINKNGELIFTFAVSHSTSAAYEPVCSLGVDIGVIYPFTCGIVGDNWYSQVIYPNSNIMGIVDKINELQRQKNDLVNDINENMRVNRTPHIASVLVRKVTERDRLSDKITRLKCEVARLSANRIVDIAYQSQAEIVLEDLSWSDPSHTFFFSLVHEKINNLAHKRGVYVRSVSAKDTSQVDPLTGSRVTQGVSVNAPVTAGKNQHLSYASSNAYNRTTRGCRVKTSGRVVQHDGISPLNLARRGYVKRVGVRESTLSGYRFTRLRFKRICWSGATEPAAGSEPTGSSVLFFRDGTICYAGASLQRALTHTESPLIVTVTETQETKITQR